MTRKPQNLSHSIRDRLLHLAQQQNEEFQNYLMRFALERWMYRLSQSEHQARFILKGALLLAVWSPEKHRPTKDLDLMARLAAGRTQRLATKIIQLGDARGDNQFVGKRHGVSH